MKTAEAFIKDQGITIPDSNIISGQWFEDNNLPMIVQCTCCGTTMVLFSAYINETGNTYCLDCRDCDVVEDDDGDDYEEDDLY